ncbi:MAG: inositol monophosphatase family protein [Propionibacteriaceae bacterium]
MDDLELAADLVHRAGVLAARMLSEGLETHYKSSVSDVVSAADHAAEEWVVGRLRTERPEDGLVGEEGSRSAGAGERTWFVDPVDGTYNFLSGLPYWCSAVGLTDADGPLLGAVYHPAVDELWVGGRDRPTTRNGSPLPALRDQPLAEISVASYVHPARMGVGPQEQAWTAVIRRAATVRMLGSASIDLSGVAAGRLGLFLQADLHDWDWVPGAALVVAAGGRAVLVPHAGHRWQIAGNSQAVAEARDAILTS